MNTFADSRQITISSSSANFLNNDSFKSSVGFTFFGMLQDEPDIVQAQISVHSAQIPISYYVVNIYNHTLKYKYHDDPVTTVTFDVGNYNANTFITEMKAKIPHLNIIFNRINGKYSFSFNQPTIFYASGSTCFKLLGLDTKQDYSGNTIDAPFPCQFQGITRIRIASNTFSTYAMDSLAGTFSNTLATIAVNSGSYGILLYENTTGYKPTLRNTVINDFDLMLLDDDENLINFNNVDWNITLQLDITRLRRENSKIFPRFSNTIPTVEDAPQSEQKQESPTEQKNLENIDVPLTDGTGDDDLDFLMYQNNIYQ